MYIYISSHIYVYIYVYIYHCIYIYKYIHMYVYMYLYTLKYVYFIKNLFSCFHQVYLLPIVFGLCVGGQITVLRLFGGSRMVSLYTIMRGHF